MKKNNYIRDLIESNRIKHYEVALELGISDTTFSRWLRYELSEEKKKIVIEAIEKIKGV